MQYTLALFDFDGTITTGDSLIKFIRFFVGETKFILGMAVLSPILIAYKLKLIPNYKAKQMMLSYFLKGIAEEQFRIISQDYSLKHIDKIIRPSALDMIKHHKRLGHKVVIVTASMECWVKPWCELNNLELVATKLEVKNGKVTGKLATKNCHGIEKVNRIKEKYSLDDCEYIYAYGDSRGDKEMLALANEYYYKPFRE